MKKYRYALLAALILLVIFTLQQLVDPDMYWHVKTGEYILNNGIPSTDPFSYWHGSVIAHEWLFNIIIYIVHLIGGIKAMHIFVYICFGAIIFISASLIENQKVFPGFFLAVAILCQEVYNLSPRPHMLSAVILTIVIYLLEKRKHLFLIPILTVVMVNIHGGMAAIIFLIAAIYWGCTIFDGNGPTMEKPFVPEMFVMGTSALALLINPFKLDAVIYSAVMNQEVYSYIGEFDPLVRNSGDATAIIVVLLPLAAMAYSWEKPKLRDVLMLCFGISMVLIYRRMMIFYVPIYIVFGMKYIQRAFLRLCDHAHWPVKMLYIFPVDTILKMLIISLSSIIIFNLVTMSGSKGEEINGYTPKIIADYIDETKLDVENNIMYNNYSFGGYFIYRDIPVFIDGRVDAYISEFGNPDIFWDYQSIRAVDWNIEELIEKYQIKYFAVYTTEPLTNYLISQNAKVLVSDKKYMLFEYGH